MELVPISQAMFEKYANIFASWLKNVAERSNGKLTSPLIRKRIREGYYQLWGAFNGEKFVAMALTEVIVTPTEERWGHLIAVLGDEPRSDWEHLIHGLIEAAKEKGLDGIMATGRAGWKQLVESVGLKPTHRVWEMRFDA